MIENKGKYRLKIIESERGWGQRIEYHFSDDIEELKNLRKEINSKNTESSAPDWYCIADEIEELVNQPVWVKRFV